MKRYFQIQGEKSGMTLGVIMANGAREALDIYAKEHGGMTWKEWCVYLGLSPEFKMLGDNRIIV